MTSPGAIRAASVDGNAPPSADRRLEGLVTAHHAFIWRSLRRLGVDSGDLDDAMQQVLLVAYRRLPDILPGSERAFLFQTALKVAADWRRSRRRRREQPGLELREVPDGAAGPEELTDRRRALALLDRALESMPLKLRAVFVLFEIEESTMAEIAELAGIPAGTVASRLRRARELFRAAVLRLTAPGGES